MSWSVAELDKNKTEQSIANETARLDACREVLEKLNKEYNHMCVKHENEELKLAEKIGKIKKSIESGEKFVKDCKEHLKTFENGAI